MRHSTNLHFPREKRSELFIHLSLEHTLHACTPRTSRPDQGPANPHASPLRLCRLKPPELQKTRSAACSCEEARIPLPGNQVRDKAVHCCAA